MPTAIIDYDAGNIQSIANMLEFLGEEYLITSDSQNILKSDRIIFPGQGSFKQAMDNLSKKNLIETIKNFISTGKPFLGICLGLQILFNSSEEAPNAPGLGIIEGEVKKYRQGKIPQIGWNKVTPANNYSLINCDYFYFVNSYYVIPKDKNLIYATSDYNGKYCCAIKKDNIMAVQFHPEKSAKSGQDFFSRWLDA